MKLVISQSMYFPWAGLLEQIRLADTFVHYDDVQHTRGFYNRVQIKTGNGVRWITVPLRDWHQGQRID
ncbi:MAG: WbqC family protein, partial [Anaerolineae bacterium]|nr:WbqC family protein [Anaerolineae bacterium]